MGVAGWLRLVLVNVGLSRDSSRLVYGAVVDCRSLSESMPMWCGSAHASPRLLDREVGHRLDPAVATVGHHLPVPARRVSGRDPAPSGAPVRPGLSVPL